MKTILNKYQTKIQVPDASNFKSSVTNFKERKTLDELVDEEGLFDETADIRVQRYLYGRIDYDNNSVYPNASKVLLGSPSYVFGFDFTQALINKFNEDWTQLAESVPTDSIYKTIQLSNKDYRDIDEAFRSYYHDLFSQYQTMLFITGRETHITDFDSYVTNFTQYCVDAHVSFTRESLIKSNHYKTDNTLLVYNLQEKKHGNDEETFQEFYMDSHILLMAEALLQHGFVLDRHAPWRFIINLKAPQFADGPEGKTLKTIFDDYYFRAYETEASHAVELLTTYYNNFVATARKKIIKEVVGPHKTLIPVQCKIERKQVLSSDHLKLTVLKFLLQMRQSEEEIKLLSTERQAVIQGLATQKKISLQAAYEKLHFFIKNKIRLDIKSNMSRPDALYAANHLGCNGATWVKNVGWIPCKSREAFQSNLEAAVLPDRSAAETLKMQLFKESVLDSIP
jgi:hypothetical protein